MPGILETFRPQWGDLEHGRHSPSKRKDDRRRPLFPARKSTVIGFVVCFLFVVIVMRRFSQIQLDIPNTQLHALDSKGSNKFAIVTFETRDVTYWRQSLGNKYDYSRRHGYADSSFGLIIKLWFHSLFSVSGKWRQRWCVGKDCRGVWDFKFRFVWMGSLEGLWYPIYQHFYSNRGFYGGCKD